MGPTLGSTDLGRDTTNALFALSGVFYRICYSGCQLNPLVFYQRLTPVPAGLSIYDQILGESTWRNGDALGQQVRGTYLTTYLTDQPIIPLPD